MPAWKNTEKDSKSWNGSQSKLIIILATIARGQALHFIYVGSPTPHNDPEIDTVVLPILPGWKLKDDKPSCSGKKWQGLNGNVSMADLYICPTSKFSSTGIDAL